MWFKGVRGGGDIVRGRGLKEWGDRGEEEMRGSAVNELCSVR
jgi:hypothetical protein